MIFDADETLRRAIKIYAAKNDLTVSDVIADACRELCAEELKQAEGIIAAEPKAKKPKRE